MGRSYSGYEKDIIEDNQLATTKNQNKSYKMCADADNKITN